MTDKANEIRREYARLADAVVAVAEENETLKAKLATADALVTCCCGNPVDSHGMGDGHSPVDKYHYAHVKLTERIETLEAAAAFLLDRMDEYEPEMSERDYHGHVHPAKARLRALVKP